MITDNNRLIIVLGMAHSGTTILTYTLKQHPDIFCFTDGSEAWLLENTLLTNERDDKIQELLNQNPNKRILLKRPWNTVFHSDWMVRTMPDAKYVYSQREFKEIIKSWSKPHSFVSDELRNTRLQRSFYNNYLEISNKFKDRIKNCKIVNHEDMARKPEATMEDLRNWLEINPFQWDLSPIKNRINIKTITMSEYRKNQL